MRFAIAIAAVIASTPALAVEGELVGNGADGQPFVRVWKTLDASEDAFALEAAGKDPNTVKDLVPLKACTVKTPQKAVTSDPTASYVRIIVTSGEQFGCRGLVRNDRFKAKD